MSRLKRVWCVISGKCPLIPDYLPKEDPEIRLYRKQTVASIRSTRQIERGTDPITSAVRGERRHRPTYHGPEGGKV